MEKYDLPRRGGGVRHLFLTGEKGVGKSTVLRRLLEGRDAPGGFRTVRVRTGEGASIHMLRAWREEDCCPENRLFVRRKGVLSLDPARFDQLGRAILAESRGRALLLMDELGPAEAGARRFQQAVLACLDGETPVYGVLQQAESGFLETVKAHPAVRVVTVTEDGRDLLPQRLREQGGDPRSQNRTWIDKPLFL